MVFVRPSMCVCVFVCVVCRMFKDSGHACLLVRPLARIWFDPIYSVHLMYSKHKSVLSIACDYHGVHSFKHCLPYSILLIWWCACGVSVFSVLWLVCICNKFRCYSLSTSPFINILIYFPVLNACHRINDIRRCFVEHRKQIKYVKVISLFLSMHTYDIHVYGFI